MRVLVCGGRAYKNWMNVWDTLDAFHLNRVRISCLIEGEAPGVDTFAKNWAMRNAVPIEPYPIERSDWDIFGKVAGPKRNAKMLAEGKPNIGIAFPGGPGTADMVGLMIRANVLVYRVDDLGIIKASR